MNKKKRKIKKKKLAVFLLALVIIFLVILFSQSGKNFDNRVSFDGASEDYKCPDCNVILITVDALRPDHLGCYGYERNTSPNIDKFAKEEGILFSQASWTCPSIHSLISSTYPSTTGVYLWDQSLSDLTPTLTQILKKKGFYTGFISAHGGLPDRNEFDTFEDVFDAKGEDITKKTALWIEKNQNKQFFLWVHYMDTHDRSIGVPIEKQFIENITPEEIKIYSSKYDEAISYVDSQIAYLLEELKDLMIYNNTIVIITADHGEEMGEHSMYFTHGGSLWDSLIRVPLIFYYPNAPHKGKVILSQVQLIDIAPTVCDILKIKKPKSFEGKSLLHLVEREDISFGYSFSEHQENQGDLSTGDWIYTKISIRSVEWKMIYYVDKQGGKEYQLYNLKNDPQELNNLADIEKGQFKLMKAELEEWMSRAKENISSLIKPLDEETKEELRSLGYLQ